MEPEPTDTVWGAKRPPVLIRAIVLVMFAVGLDGLAVILGMTDGGRGWAFEFPLIGLSALAAMVCAVISASCTATTMASPERRVESCVVIVLAGGVIVFAVVILNWSVAAVQAV